MKQLSVQVRIRNNLLLERRQKLGLTQEQMAAAIGIHLSFYGPLEGLRASPLMKKIIPGCCAPGCKARKLAYPPIGRLCKDHVGVDAEVASMWRKQAYEMVGWRDSALKIAEFFDVSPEELWPDEVTNICNPVASRTMDVSEVVGLIDEMPDPPLLPSESIERREDIQNLEAALQTLTPRQEKVLRERFGIGGETSDLKKIGDEIGVSRERVRQIEAKALSEMRFIMKSKKVVVQQTTCPGCGRIVSDPMKHHPNKGDDGIWTCRRYRITCPGCGRMVVDISRHHPRDLGHGHGWVCDRTRDR